MNRLGLALGSCALLVGVVGMWVWLRQPATASGPMSQHAYIWQRQWDGPVTEAVSAHGRSFDRLVVLGAEVTFQAGDPQIVRVTVDHDALRQTGRPIGLALRLGPYAGTYAPDGQVTETIAQLASERIEAMRRAGLEPAELQIDFDAATSDLAGYRIWIEAVRQAVGPVPVTITALPSWMRSSDFGGLVLATDGYVLQVHALQRPGHAEAAVRLVEPGDARRWVRQAGGYGVPFRVALPTYGYLLAFDPAGQFIGLNAEGPMPEWPAGTRLRELDADPQTMVELVKAWTADRPITLQGVSWYRLPTTRDVRNWRWATLDAVMAGLVPQSQVSATTHQPEPGLIEIELANTGAADAAWPGSVTVRWPGDTRPIAHDALGGFVWRSQGPGLAVLSGPDAVPPPKLRPGDRIPIAWLRFAQQTEVRADVQTPDP